MFGQAFIVMIVSWLLGFVDTVLGWQTLSRPIVCGAVTGIACGDPRTGIIMGAELEAVYMGVSGIGGVVPADSKNATIISTAIVILGGVDVEAGLAIASAVGALMVNTMTVTISVSDALNPLFLKAAQKHDFGKTYRRLLWAWTAFGSNLLNNVIIFFAIALGAEGVSAVINQVPDFLIRGLKAAGGAMAAVGIGILAYTIWSKESAIFVLVGFVCAKYLGLSSLTIGIIGFIFAYILFMNDLAHKKISESTKSIEEEDDLYD